MRGNRKELNCESRERNNVQFAGIQIEKHQDGFSTPQINYVKD